MVHTYTKNCSLLIWSSYLIGSPVLRFAKSYQSNGCGHLWTSRYSYHFFLFQPNKEFGLFVGLAIRGKRHCLCCCVQDLSSCSEWGQRLSTVLGLPGGLSHAEPRLQGTQACGYGLRAQSTGSVVVHWLSCSKHMGSSPTRIEPRSPWRCWILKPPEKP